MSKQRDAIQIVHLDGPPTVLAAVAASRLGYGNQPLRVPQPRPVSLSSSVLGQGAHVPLPSGDENEKDFLEGSSPWTGKPNF
jgi:hypothetical protein